METLTLDTNLNCGNCVARVKPYLDAAPGVHHWHVDTSLPNKPLTVHGSGLTPDHIAAVVAQSGFAVLGAPAATPAAPAPTAAINPGADTRSWLQTYYPLLLLVGFVLGGVLLREATLGRWAWMPMMENFMGGFFAAFAFFKLLDVPGFAASYASYDLVAQRWLGWGYVYPFVELALGLAFLAGPWPVATNATTLVLMLLGLAGVWRSLRQRRTIQCACLGTVFNLPMSTVTLVEDGGMAAMAATMLAYYLA